MRNNYDTIAYNYDWLSRLIFGDAQIKAQTTMLAHIPAGSRVLIAGGGTGWILESIAGIHPAGLDIVYVEISRKMLLLSQKRFTGKNTVKFIHQPMEECLLQEKFDVIITAFFFDNFPAAKGEKVFSQLHSYLSPGGRWLFADFTAGTTRGRWWKKALLKIMYVFFRVVSNIEATQLTNMNSLFTAAGYRAVFRSYNFGHFIESVVFAKPGL